MGKKLSYQEVKEYIESYGCELLSEEYVNNTTKLKIRCKCGNVFERTYNVFQTGANKCTDCSGVKLSYKKVKEFIETYGCELLSEEYVDYNTNLKIRCACGEVFKTSYASFKGGQRCCIKCSGGNHTKKLTYEEVKEFIKNCGCKLLDEEYINYRSKLKIQCSCGEVFYASFDRFKAQNKRQCNKCAIKMNSGKNHSRYNPSLTDEERENKRKCPQNNEWVVQVFNRDNYTCQCCGDNKGGNLNAHHLNGHNWDKANRHNVYNGITLCEECHKDFHSKYKYGYNTLEQFIEYIESRNDVKITVIEDIKSRRLHLK